MNLGRLNHVGVATPSIEQSLELYRTMFHAEPHGPAFDLPAQGVRVCFVDTPNSQIELIEPLGADSPILKFLEKNPLGGQHHLCFEVADIEEARAEAVVLSGELLRDLGGQFWNSSEWQIRVEDEAGDKVCALTFSADRS